ncbi:hypothetical protein BDP55DRAFT_663121 [Colletotrichum godetiae]|uniref:Uncharacterized protein n=1 Tax=Colletotrichum godetiae TaxID=1209918 RepID=A0AAJ0ALG0_9PEZI|nr:uncharacterized protein BDP55DRAFT_663121 [Colletotrichum godetiae]KAK1676084.1 hypothetical protein BDP55DRAFT_663121 [Colletotrichum godetiae]
MGGKAFRTLVWSLFYFYYVWHFLFIRHNGSPHWPACTMSWATAVSTLLLFMTLLDVYFLFFSPCQLVSASTRVFGIGVGDVQFMGRQVICSSIRGWSGGFTEMNPTNQQVVGTGARFVCRAVAVGHLGTAPWVLAKL